MNIEKIHLDDIKRCYCASHIDIDDVTYAFFASEDPKSPCNAYSGNNFEKKEKVWDDRGGCMSIIPIPNKKGEFLAVNEFYLKVSPSLSKLVWGKRVNNEWIVSDVLSLPYLHRFDIYNVNGKNYVICATIAEAKENKEDWSKPGQIYVGELPDNPTEGIKLEKIVDGCFRNHGYSRSVENGKVYGYFGSDQGVIKVTPPYDGEWKTEKVLEGTISEVALVDIDNDGVKELMTIEPFHGNVMKIYKQKDGKYEAVYTYPYEIDFAHSLVGTTICGVNTFVGGVRRVNAELFMIQYINNEYQLTIIENGVGPANVDVIHGDNCEYILSANHTLNEAAIYKVSK